MRVTSSCFPTQLAYSSTNLANSLSSSSNREGERTQWCLTTLRVTSQAEAPGKQSEEGYWGLEPRLEAIKLESRERSEAPTTYFRPASICTVPQHCPTSSLTKHQKSTGKVSMNTHCQFANIIDAETKRQLPRDDPSPFGHQKVEETL